ncbi:MAG: molybdopterin-dependent oxidoreductase [Desulfurococcales archaeon]|nr:molybdopterin-dependent oxidoreductase [Desulfurococcales archaeon]
MTSNLLRGCKLYYNGLLSSIDLPLVFECSPIGSTSYGGLKDLASSAAQILGEMVGYKIKLEWHDLEIVGRKFRVDKFFVLADSEGILGELRVVERDGYPLVVSGAMTRKAVNLMDSDVVDELRKGVLVWGEEPLPIYMEEGETGSMPPGQRKASRFVIYAAEGIPYVREESWSLLVRDESSKSRRFTLEELYGLGVEEKTLDFHCVTGWSVKSVKLAGVPVKTLLSKAGISARDGWLVVVSVKGYSTVIPLKEALEKNSIIVLKINGKPLTPEQGAPARIFVPGLYGWKSAKWLSEIMVFKEYIDGFWEALGYHERGRADYEERFKIRNLDYVDSAKRTARQIGNKNT